MSLAPVKQTPRSDSAGLSSALAALSGQLEGELHVGSMLRRLYSTDASEYQELPSAVALPMSEADLQKLLTFAQRHRIGIIPLTIPRLSRAAQHRKGRGDHCPSLPAFRR